MPAGRIGLPGADRPAPQGLPLATQQDLSRISLALLRILCLCALGILHQTRNDMTLETEEEYSSHATEVWAVFPRSCFPDLA